MPIAVHHVKAAATTPPASRGKTFDAANRQPIIKIKYSVIVNGTLGGGR
jgi:hypothetical protein